MAYCEKCGAYIPDGQSKCLACGFDGAEEERVVADDEFGTELYRHVNDRFGDVETHHDLGHFILHIADLITGIVIVFLKLQWSNLFDQPHDVFYFNHCLKTTKVIYPSP